MIESRAGVSPDIETKHIHADLFCVSFRVGEKTFLLVLQIQRSGSGRRWLGREGSRRGSTAPLEGPVWLRRPAEGGWLT